MKTRIGLMAAFFALVSTFAAPAQGATAKESYQRLVGEAASVDFASLVLEAARGFDSVSDAIWLLGATASHAATGEQRRLLLYEQATLLELTGRYDLAADAWEAAARAVAGLVDGDAIVSAAACRLLEGDSAAAAVLAKAATFAGASSKNTSLAGLIGGWAALALGDRDGAHKAARELLLATDERILFSALSLARASADGDDTVRYERMLEERFPALWQGDAGNHPSLRLLMASTIASIPGDPPAKPAESTAPATSDQTIPSDSGSVAITYQVGAFRDEANAAIMVGKLKKLGLLAYTIYKKSTGIHIVLVRASDEASARTMILTLKDAGYEAWRIESEQ
ncbi:MAG: SPOR domain-containing protein [Spirochaetales bacterium]|nr:SPOR domain-containing protein [Spirochaetales bacterium]